MVDSNLALKIAPDFAGKKDELGEFAGGVLSGKVSPIPKRNFWDAFWCRDVEHL
jgi:hypothetical protein